MPPLFVNGRVLHRSVCGSRGEEACAGSAVGVGCSRVLLVHVDLSLYLFGKVYIAAPPTVAINSNATSLKISLLLCSETLMRRSWGDSFACARTKAKHIFTYIYIYVVCPRSLHGSKGSRIPDAFDGVMFLSKQKHRCTKLY